MSPPSRRSRARRLTKEHDRLSQWPWVAVVAAIVYVCLVTADFRVGPVPLKALLTLLAVGGWAWHAQRRGTRRPRWSGSVLLLAVGVPTAWLAVAALRLALDDPAQGRGLTDAVEQASRFTYLLFYFPLVDWYRRRRDESSHRIWLWGVFALCSLTWLLYLGGLVLGLDYGDTLDSGPFRGDIALDERGSYRVFLINQVILIPACVFLLARVRLSGIDWVRFAQLALVIGTAFLSHTRGIWLGIAVGVGIVMLDAVRSAHPFPAWASAAVLCALLVAFSINAAPQVAQPVVRAVTGGPEELSTESRLRQGPELVRGFERHPIVGSGLGATLPSGYTRSADDPWSFELAWLQLLFQIGIVGTACVLFAPCRAAYAAWRAIPQIAYEKRVMPVAGAGGIVGFLLACGSNPYLMTSIGTASLAIMLALCAAEDDEARTAERDRFRRLLKTRLASRFGIRGPRAGLGRRVERT